MPTPHWLAAFLLVLPCLSRAVDAQVEAESVEPWTPAVWLAPDVDPQSSTPERSQQLIEQAVHWYTAYVDTGRYEEAIPYFESLVHLAGAHHLPGWVSMEAWFGLAVCHLRTGNLEAGFDALDESVFAGFADPQTFHERVPRSAWKHPRAARAYGRMVLSELDDHEMQWFFGEMQAIGHDTRMMITFNIHRKDRDMTRVFNVDVPTRTTRSATVASARQVLVLLQRRQREQVARSDGIRKSHLTTMTIAGGGDVPIEEVLLSIRVAEEREREHARSIEARQYRRPGNLTDQPVELPALGSIEVDQAIPAPVAAPAIREANLERPLRGVRIGDWWKSEMRILVEGKEIARQSMRSWVTHRDGERVSFITVREADDRTSVEDGSTRVEPTMLRQLLFDLSREAPVEIHAYDEARVRLEYRGRQIAAHRVDMEFDWTLNGDRDRWKARAELAPDLLAVTPIRTYLEGPGFAFEINVMDHGRAQ